MPDFNGRACYSFPDVRGFPSVAEHLKCYQGDPADVGTCKCRNPPANQWPALNRLRPETSFSMLHELRDVKCKLATEENHKTPMTPDRMHNCAQCNDQSPSTSSSIACSTYNHACNSVQCTSFSTLKFIRSPCHYTSVGPVSEYRLSAKTAQAARY